MINISMIWLLNQIFSSFNPELSVVTILFVSFIQCINCDCGPPRIPYHEGVYPQNKSSFPENCEGVKYSMNEKWETLQSTIPVELIEKEMVETCD
jgi:hypothetical protein